MTIKVVVIGHHNSGKGAFSEAFARMTGLRYRNTSKLLLESFIWASICTGYSTREACYVDRYNRPALWSELINFHCKDDEAKALRHVMKNCDIYKGLRCQSQFHAGLEQGLFDYVVMCESESQKEDPYLTIDPEYVDFTARISGKESASSEAARITREIKESFEQEAGQ